MSEVFVASVQEAAETFGMTPAFVGFIVVALVGAAAEMASAFSGARKNRLDLSVGIALGQRLPDRPVRGAGAGAAELRHRPRADGPAILAGCRGDDADRHPHRVAGDHQRTLGVVRRRARADGLPDLRHDPLPVAAAGPMIPAVGKGVGWPASFDRAAEFPCQWFRMAPSPRQPVGP